MEETSNYVKIEDAGKNYYGYENWEYMNYDEDDWGDKMKIIRRLEELDELENGKGLKLIVHASSFKGCVWVKVYYNTWLEIKDIKNFDESDIKLLKAMGFEFEWKLKRTEDEILSKYEPCKFIKHVCDHYVRFDGSRCVIAKDIDYPKFGYCYYNEETAKKVCEELNS